MSTPFLLLKLFPHEWDAGCRTHEDHIYQIEEVSLCSSTFQLIMNWVAIRYINAHVHTCMCVLIDSVGWESGQCVVGKVCSDSQCLGLHCTTWSRREGSFGNIWLHTAGVWSHCLLVVPHLEPLRSLSSPVNSGIFIHDLYFVDFLGVYSLEHILLVIILFCIWYL